MSTIIKTEEKFDPKRVGVPETIRYKYGELWFSVDWKDLEKEIHENQLCLVDPHTRAVISVCRLSSIKD